MKIKILQKSILWSIFLLTSVFLISCTGKGVLRDGGKKTTSPKTASSNVVTSVQSKTEVTFWHYNQEEGNALVKAFQEKHPDITVKFTYIPNYSNKYVKKVVLLANSDSSELPDVFACDFASIQFFIAHKIFDNLSTAPFHIEIPTQNMFPYTVNLSKDESGNVMALPYSTAPGGMAYKRELAKTYLGTDDPTSISEMMSTPSKDA